MRIKIFKNYSAPFLSTAAIGQKLHGERTPWALSSFRGTESVMDLITHNSHLLGNECHQLPEVA